VFHFRGSISYNSPNGDFEVSTAESMVIVRASRTPWNFREIVPANPNHPKAPSDLASPDFSFLSVTCTSTGTSVSTINGVPFSVGSPFTSTDPEGTSLVAGAGDAVLCTYTDKSNVTRLSVFKQTTGGFGGPFVVNVTPPVGTPPPTTGPPPWNVTADVADVPVLAGTMTDPIPSGGLV